MNRGFSTRRQFLRTAGAAGACVLAAPSISLGASRARRPNILFMVADDQRHDVIAALGNGHIQTPHLDRLARSGFSFRQARCMGAMQGAVCVPARAMIHTGRTLFRCPEQIGDSPMWVEQLAKAGYTTFGCGKWHNGPRSFARAFTDGGNIFFGGMHDQFDTPVQPFDPSGKYPRKRAASAGKFSSDAFADAAVDFLSRQKSAEKPFVCYCAFTSPHDPRTPPAPYKTMYDPGTMPLPGNFLPVHPFDNGDMKVRDEKLAPFPRTPENTRRQLCDYYGMVTSQDAAVGRMLKALEESGQYENTIIVYTGDHGLAIGSHGLFGKQNVYEHSECVPMVIAGPGIPHAAASDALVYGLDLCPTMCEVAGVGVPDTVEGKSLKPIMQGQARTVRNSAFGAYQPGRGRNVGTQRAVRDARWKLIRYHVAGKVTTQLFDLQADPIEMHNLATDAAATGELARMEKLLHQWQQNLGDPWPDRPA